MVGLADVSARDRTFKQCPRDCEDPETCDHPSISVSDYYKVSRDRAAPVSSVLVY